MCVNQPRVDYFIYNEGNMSLPPSIDYASHVDSLNSNRWIENSVF